MEYPRHGEVTRREWLRFMSHIIEGKACYCSSVPHKHWLWKDHIRKNDGYASFGWRGNKLIAHRFAYIALKGDIPKELITDHLCRIHTCANPLCIEPVTIQINVLRGQGISAQNHDKTHCKYGHPFSEENTEQRKYYRADGKIIVQRRCKLCKQNENRTRRSPL